MDIPSKKYNSDAVRPGSIITTLQAIIVFISSLISFFTLTEEDRLKAGVHRGSEGCDE